MTNEIIRPYRINIPQSQIDDLNHRLSNTRWPDRELVSDWSQGVPLHKAQALVKYWRETYSWRRFERDANAFPQFITNIDGLDIHFFHVKSKLQGRDATPLLLLHGWPGSFVEFLKMIRPLTEPENASEAFDVVLPSLPGWGFTESPRELGWDMARTARACITLMEDRLGYNQRWIAQGGDYGAAVATLIAQQKPKGLLGIHLNLLFVIPQEFDDNEANTTDEERDAMSAFLKTQTEQGGFKHISATRPQTIAYSLTDSPVGQATWIYEKFYEWTDHSGDPEDAVTIDEILDNISVYWFSNCAASSSRKFWEGRNFKLDIGPVDLPVAALVFEKDIWKFPRKWVDRAYRNLVHHRKVDKGAHFGALEQPTILVDDLRAALRAFLRSS